MQASRSEVTPDETVGRDLFGRRALIALAIGLPVSAFFLLEAARGTHASDVRSALSHARIAPLCLAVVAMGGVYLLQAARWRYIANVYGDLPLPRSVAYVVGGVAINNVVPGRPGELVRGYWCSRDLGVPWATGFSTVIIDRASDVVALTLFLVVSWETVPHPAWARDFASAALILCALLIIGFLACRWYVMRRERSGKGVPERWRSLWLIRQAALLVRGTAGAVTPRRLVVVGAFSLAAWSVWALGAYLTASALSIHFTLGEAVFAAAVINVGVAIPSSPGFIGTYQWLCVSTLALFGVPRDDAFAFSVLMHAVWFVPTTVAGLILLVVSVVNRRRARRPGHEGTRSLSDPRPL